MSSDSITIAAWLFLSVIAFICSWRATDGNPDTTVGDVVGIAVICLMFGPPFVIGLPVVSFLEYVFSIRIGSKS